MAGILEFGKVIQGRRYATGTGVTRWSLEIDREGHREYTINFRVRAGRSDLKDGPATIANTAGLPIIGAPWRTSSWNLGSELDLWARCTPYLRVTPYESKNDVTEFWDVECKFSTRPMPLGRCHDNRIEDPLLEPQRVSGSFAKKKVEAKTDKDGDLIKSSSHEPIHGESVEFDDLYPSVTIVQNVPALQLPIMSQLARKTVNGVAMWGLPVRTVRLAGASWSREVVGACEYYYTRTFEFEIDYNTFDKTEIVDEGTKAFGHWDPEFVGSWVDTPGGDVNNPADFERYVDRKGEIAHVMLDGTGRPLAEDKDYEVIPLCQDPPDGKGAVKYYLDTIDLGNGDVPVDYIVMLGVPAWF